MLESMKRLKTAVEAASIEDEVPNSLFVDVAAEAVQRVAHAVSPFADAEIPFLMAALRFVALQLIMDKDDKDDKALYENMTSEVLSLLQIKAVSVVIPVERSDLK